MAGNDSNGLYYGTTKTEEKYFLKCLMLPAGKTTKMKIELIDTQLMMKEVTTVLGSEINHTGAEIRWEVSAVPFVFSSVHFLKSALEQLVLNSLKFRDESRKLIVMITAVKSDHAAIRVRA